MGNGAGTFSRVCKGSINIPADAPLPVTTALLLFLTLCALVLRPIPLFLLMVSGGSLPLFQWMVTVP